MTHLASGLESQELETQQRDAEGSLNSTLAHEAVGGISTYWAKSGKLSPMCFKGPLGSWGMFIPGWTLTVDRGVPIHPNHPPILKMYIFWWSPKIAEAGKAIMTRNGVVVKHVRRIPFEMEDATKCPDSLAVSCGVFSYIFKVPLMAWRPYNYQNHPKPIIQLR